MLLYDIIALDIRTNKEIYMPFDNRIIDDIINEARKNRNELPYIEFKVNNYKPESIGEYISALSNNDLPENLELVIIDESPNVLESISLNEDKLKLLEKIARCQNDYDAGVLLDFINDITRYKDGGSHKMPSLDKDIADNVLKIALTRLRSGKLNEESMDVIYSFLTFFSKR